MPTLREKARNYTIRQEWEKAKRCYALLINMDPEDLSLYLERHIVFLHEQRFPEAMEDLERIILETEGKEEEEFLGMRAEAFRMKSSHFATIFKDINESIIASTAAISLYANLANLDPRKYIEDLIDQYYNRAELFFEAKRMAFAKEDFTEGIELSEIVQETINLPCQMEDGIKARQMHGLRRRGAVFESLRKWRSAKEDYKNIPGYLGEFLIGRMYFTRGKLKRAKIYLNLALSRGIQDCDEYRDILIMSYISARFLGEKEEKKGN